MVRSFRQILYSKYLLIPAAVATATVAVIVIYFASIRDKVIFPNPQNYHCDYYTDAPNKGNSQMVHYAVSDSLISFGFLLGDGFYSPYAGLIFTPFNKLAIDASRYNQINVQIKGTNIDRVGIAIYTPLPLDVKGSDGDEALYHSYLNILDHRQTYQLPLSQFQHPDWWEDLHHIPKNQDNTPDLTNILHINIGSAFSSIADKNKSLTIYSITFTRNNQEVYRWLGITYVIFIVLLLTGNYLIMSWRGKVSQITISYQPLVVPQQTKGDDKCIEYINTHYQDSNLTLEKIAEETRISARRITSLIHDKFNCNFKTYLNRIRIHESKSLLLQTDLNIGEIAFKVGFNNQSHFNRVFKTECQVSPTEYREKVKK